ncbi:hypothetical protein AFEL58S_00212 [Afipia felis]
MDTVAMTNKPAPMAKVEQRVVRANAWIKGPARVGRRPMQKLVIGAIAALTLGSASAAVSGDSLEVFPKGLNRVSGEMIRTKLESIGYRVDRLEAEHHYWEVRAVNDSGSPIKAKYDLTTGELMQAKLR